MSFRKTRKLDLHELPAPADGPDWQAEIAHIADLPAMLAVVAKRMPNGSRGHYPRFSSKLAESPEENRQAELHPAVAKLKLQPLIPLRCVAASRCLARA